MATQLISPGPSTLLKAGVTYALPARVCRIQAAAPVTISVDGTTFSALTGADTTGVETSAVFIKAAADTLIVAKY